MKIYYTNSEYTAGKRKIIIINYDKDDFTWKNNIRAEYSIKYISEVDPENKDICRDLAEYNNRYDEFGEKKYFIDNEGDICENIGWKEYIPKDLYEEV